MAVVTTKSTQITNRDSTPAVFNNSRTTKGEMTHARAVVAIANGDSVASKFIALSVPSNAVIAAVRLTAPDIGTTTAVDVGLYQTTANGGAVVDADFFASAVALNAGAINKSDVTFESGVGYLIANGEKPLWEALALTADSGRDYDVVLTMTGAADAAGSVLVEVDYTV